MGDKGKKSKVLKKDVLKKDRDVGEAQDGRDVTANPSVGSKIGTVEDALAHMPHDSSGRSELEGILVKLVKDYIGPVS